MWIFHFLPEISLNFRQIRDGIHKWFHIRRKCQFCDVKSQYDTKFGKKKKEFRFGYCDSRIQESKSF